MRPIKTCRRKKQYGQVSIIVTLSLVVLIGSVGLAIDSGLGYMIKAKLNAAVDSAGIAAAGAVTQGKDWGEQKKNAEQAAQDFFYANYPASGYLGSTPVFPKPIINTNSDKPGQIIIDTSASASVPVTLMRSMGFDFLSVAAASQTIRNDLDMAFVIDASGSMQPSGIQVRSEAKTFLSRFDALHDRMALIHFSVGAVVDDHIQPVSRGFDLVSMNTHIDNINFSGKTNSPEGFWNARNELNSITPAQRSTLRVIVFFSDGAPNTFSSQIKFNSSSSCVYPATSPGNGFRMPGSIISDDTASGVVTGLGQIDQQNQPLSGKFSPAISSCNLINGVSLDANNALPQYYNAHPVLATNVNTDEFHLSDSSPRPANATPTYANVNRVSRNLVEEMADKARSEGIYVFTLGLGGQLTTPSGPDGERGDVVLKCMANSVDAKPSCIKANQPVGLYCYAVDASALKPCFEKLASAILRISK